MPRKNPSSTKNLSINTKNRGPRDGDDDVEDEYDDQRSAKAKTPSTATKQNKNKNQVKSGASSRTSSRSSASSTSSSTSSSNEKQDEDDDDDEKQFDPDALKVLHRFGSAPSVNNLTALSEQEKAAATTKKSGHAFPKAPNNNADTRPASNVSTAYSATPASVSLRAASNNTKNNALNSTPSSDMLSSQQGTNNMNTASTMSMPNTNNYNNHVSGEFPSSTEIYDSSEDVSAKNNSNANTKKNNENNDGVVENDDNEVDEEEEEDEDDDDDAGDDLQQQEEEEDPFHQLRGHHPTGVLFVPRAPRNEKQLGRLTKAPYKGASRLKGPKWTFLWHCLPCRYGDECVFKKKQMFCKRAHTQEELRCPQYALYGICKAGANCKLNHSLGTMDEARRLSDVQRQKQVDDETKKLVEMKRQQLELLNGGGDGENNNNNSITENAGPTLIPLPTQTTLDALPTLTMTVREQKDRLWKTQMCVRGDQCRAFRLNFWCHDCHDPKELRCKSFALFGVCLDAERGCPLVHSNRTEKQEMQRIRSQIENSRFMTGDYGDDEENGEDRHHLQVPGVKPPSKNINNNKNKNNVSAMKIPSSNPNNAHDNSSSSSSCHSSSSSSSGSSSSSSDEDDEDDKESETENKSTASSSTNPVSANKNKNANEAAKVKDHASSVGKGNRHGHSHRHHHGGGGGGAGGVKKWNFKVGNAGGIPERFKRASQVGDDDELDDMVRGGDRGSRGMNRSTTSNSSNNNNQVGRGGKKSTNDIFTEDIDPDADEVMKSSLIVDGKVALKTAVQIPIKFVEKGGKKGRGGSRQSSAKTSPSLPPQQQQQQENEQNQQHVDPNNNNATIGNPKKPQKKPFVLAENQQQQSSSKFLLRAERNLYKTEFCPSLHFCREYRNYNWCDDAHTLDELRCPQFALTGKCPREDRCPLRHNQETRAEAKLQCEDYRKKTLGLKATKLRPDQMRTLPNPEVLTPALAAKLSAMAESQRKLLLSNTAFCPLGVDCRPHSQGLPCGQCHEANDLLCPYQMLYGECICPTVAVGDTGDKNNSRIENVDSGYCTTKCTRQHVDTDFPDTPLPTNNAKKQENDGAAASATEDSQQPLHHRHRVLVVGGNNNTSEATTPLITNKNGNSTPTSTSLASPSSLLAVPSNSPSRGGKNKKNAPAIFARSGSHFFDEKTGEALFYVDVPPSLTITGASPLVQDNDDQKDGFDKKSHHHHHHHHHHHEKSDEQETDTTNNNNENELAASPKSPPQFKTTPLASSAATTGNTFTTTSATNTANQNNHHHHGRSFSNSSTGSTASSPTSNKNQHENNDKGSNNNNSNAGVNILPLNATSNSAGPSMPNHWVDYLWKTRWCPLLANCKEYLTGSSWCFGAHEESELRCPQYALTQVLQEKFAKEIESGEIKIDEKYGACPRGSECPFCHTSGTAKEQKAKFARGEDPAEQETAQKITSTTSSKSLGNMSASDEIKDNNNNNKTKSPIQQPASVVSPVVPEVKPEAASTFVEPAIPEALLSQYRIMKSAERRRLFFKTSLCPLLAPLCEDCVHNRCFFASTLRELRCPYFSLFGLCPRRRCEWLHCTHEALGTCRSPALNWKPSPSANNVPTFSSKSPSSTPSTSALSSPQQQHNHPLFRVDPPEFLWPPTPQLTPQISAKKNTNNKNDDDEEDEPMPDLNLQ